MRQKHTCTFCELKNLKRFWRYEHGYVVCITCHRLLDKDDLEALVWRRLDLRTLADRFKHRHEVDFEVEMMTTTRFTPVELVHLKELKKPGVFLNRNATQR